MKLRGPRVTIRQMRREDMDAMAQWRPLDDPLYQAFDLPQRSLAEHHAWFDDRVNDPTRRLFAVENETGQVIGSLTLRDIDGLRSARLGITLGADFSSQGYGTETLRIFLEAFFGMMGFGRMDLDVAATNQRALRCYRSLGFRQVGQHYEAAYHPSYRILAHEPRYRHLRPCFRRLGAAVKVLFYDMVLTRQEFLDARRAHSTSSSDRIP
jgi:RimJ/RimL family protein N-acetyltransferase